MDCDHASALDAPQASSTIDTAHINFPDPLRGPELRALRRVRRDYPETPYVFVSERKAPLTPDAVRKIVTRAG